MCVPGIISPRIVVHYDCAWQGLFESTRTAALQEEGPRRRARHAAERRPLSVRRAVQQRLSDV